MKSTYTSIAALLASAHFFMLPDDAGGDPNAPAAPADETGGGLTDRQRAIIDAVGKLNDANDDHWLSDGRPKMEAVEAIFGDTTPTREEVDKVGRVRQTPGADSDKVDPPADDGSTLPDPASTEPDPNPPPPPAADRPAISKGRIVLVTLDKPFDGETEVVGIVVKVNDDGSINARLFAPNGGSDGFANAARHADEVAAMPEGADRNAASSAVWSFPPRV